MCESSIFIRYCNEGRFAFKNACISDTFDAAKKILNIALKYSELVLLSQTCMLMRDEYNKR